MIAERSRSWRTMAEGAAVVLLLALFIAQAASLIRHTSATVDEDGHVGAGVSYWVNGDYRLQTFNGFLTQRMIGLPGFLAGRKFPPLDAQAAAELSPNRVGDLYLFTLGHDPVAVLAEARAVVTAIGVALALGVFAWARRLFGTAGGIGALVFYVTAAGIVANSALATTDIPLAALYFAAMWCYLALLARPSVARAVLSGVCVAALLLTKYSAIGFMPLALVLLALHGRRRRPRAIEWRRLARHHVLVLVVAWAGIWAFFGFQFRPGNYEPVWTEARAGTKLHAAVQTLRRAHVLPEPYLFFLQGSRTLVAPRYSFFHGEHRNGGRLIYFPATLALKTSPWLLGAIALAGGLTLRRCLAPHAAPAADDKHERTTEIAALWLLAAVYLGCCMAARLNIGQRHLLPIYAPLCVLAGGAIAWLWQQRRLRVVALALFVGAGVETAWLHGRQHAYLSPLAGGPAAAYRWFADSSVDWGTDLPRLAAWQREIARREPDARFHLAHLGVDYPQAYGVRGALLNLPFAPEDLRGGIFVFSASVHQSGTIFRPGDYRAHEPFYQQLRARVPRGTIDDELAKSAVVRLAGWCRDQRPPDERVGDTYFVYRLSDAEVRAALDAPLPPLRAGLGNGS